MGAEAKPQGEKKSGIKRLTPGEVLFNENDPAESLFIIQKGQLRLYRPKGRGFIEIAILRSGEVIGEMAYFDEKSSRRSCSAAAIVTTEIIEISFKAFEKTMSGLNPWFKTIIQTLADRLRTTNDKLKQLESNSLGYTKGGGSGDYVFFHNADIVKLFTTFFMAFKAHGESVDGGVMLHHSVINFYASDIYGTSEVKLEEFRLLLENEGFLTVANDQSNLPNNLIIRDIGVLRSIMIFLNGQRLLEDDKKIQLTDKAIKFVKTIINELAGNTGTEEFVSVDLTEILDRLANEGIDKDHYREIIDASLAKELIIDKGNKIFGKVHYQKLRKIYPALLIMNAVKRVNESKSQHKG